MEQIKIDIVPVGVAPVAHASQFDNGRQIRFNLFNQGTPYTLTGAETVTMVVNGEEENITNTSDNYVIWDVAEEDCEKVGVIGCEIRIVLGSMLIGSKNFFLEVEMDPYDGKNIRIVTVGPADICTFETTLPEPYQSVLVNVLATGGNGTPDNPNPINGYSSANITRCGVNLFTYDLPIHEGYWSSNAFVGSDNVVSLSNASGWTNIRVKVPEGENITLSGFQAESGVYGVFLGSDNPTDRISSFYNWQTNSTMTVPSGAKYIGICFKNLDTEYVNYPNAQLELGSTASDYEPYNGNTYTIAFGQTVYGGVLDVTRGKLHVTRAGDTINNMDFQYWAGGVVFYANITDKKNGNTNVISDIYETLQNGGYGELSNGQIVGRSDGNTIYIKDTAYTDVSAFKSARGNSLIVYELATPFDIDLTPEVISAVVGTNNVFADCGQTEVKYLTEG